MKYIVKKPRQTRSVNRKSVQATSPVDVAFVKIKEMMYCNELAPGQKLIYQQLADKLDMSVTPIIQALNRLRFLNIVYTIPNKGYYVGEVSPKEVKELFLAREALEFFLIPTIIGNLTEKKLDAIENVMEKYIEAASSPRYGRTVMVMDSDFHLKIIQSAENEVIFTICSMIFEQIYLKYRPEYIREARVKETMIEHRMLFKSLKEKDAKKYRRLIKQHIKNGRKNVIGSLFLQDINVKI
jgi:DNA-binding GntR family transcriptional regulator